MYNDCFSNSGIGLACEAVGGQLAQFGVDRREVLRVKLALEEVLLGYQSALGEDAGFQVRCVRRLSSIRIEASAAGKPLNPLETEDEETGAIQGLLAQIGLVPAWSYRSGKNRIVFIARKKSLSEVAKIVCAIGLALVCGSAMHLLPEGVRAGVQNGLLTPLADGLLGLIFALSGPVLFFSILGSILELGSLDSLGKVAGRTLRIILLYSALIGTAMTAVGSLFCPVEWGGAGVSDFRQVLDLLYDIIPGNLFEPFLTGNALQIIFISVIVGLAMLVLSSRVSAVFSLVHQLSAIIQTTMSGLSSLLPLLIFAMLTQIVAGGSLGAGLHAWKILAINLALSILYYAGTVLWIALRKRVSPLLLIKKAWPTFLIGLTTASSGAAFSTNLRDATEKLGIDPKLAGFAIPLGQVLFMPTLIAELFAAEIVLAELCGISITVPWLVIGLITNILLAFATPPIPGGSMMCYSIAFTLLGIPMEMLGLALALVIVIDFTGTATCVSGWQLTLIDVADSLNMLDRKVLRSDC